VWLMTFSCRSFGVHKRWTTARWLPAVALASFLPCFLLAAIALGATRLPRLLANDGGHIWQVRPAQILYTGDGSGRLGGFDGTGLVHPGHVKWASWTQTEAVGSGAVWIDDLGTVTAHRAEVTAFRRVEGRFTRLTLRYSYHGKLYVDRRGIRRTGGTGTSWGYYILGR
jgi:hypothetical protein